MTRRTYDAQKNVGPQTSEYNLQLGGSQGESSVNIAVYGSGAVGGYFGARLAEGGHDVTFIARGKHLAAIRATGLRVSSPKGDVVITPATVTDEPTTVGVVDIVLVGVKAGQVSEIAPTLASMVGPDTVVVPLQNGIEAATELAAGVGAAHVIGGLCRVVTSLTEPGHITHAALDPTVVIGELDGSSSDRILRVRDALEQAGVTVETPDDIRVALWEKFLLIAPWGGLGGLTRVTLDVLCHTPETRQLLEQAMAEVAALAAAHDVRLPSDVAVKTASYLAGLPPGGTASMQRDLIEGRPSELDAQTGSIVRLGRATHVDTPVNSFIYDCLKPGERFARGERS